MIKRLTFLCLLILPLVALPAVFLTPNQPPGTVQLAWDPSPDPSVEGYFIYWGTASRQYTNRFNAGKATNAKIQDLPRGPILFFTATAFVTEGTNYLESVYCNEVQYQAKPFPAPPSGMKATNAVLQVMLEQAPIPRGPWREFGLLFASPEEGYFRARLAMLAPPDLATGKRSVLKEFPPVPADATKDDRD